AALGDALTQTRALEGRERELPRPDRLRVASPQIADDPQVVGAATRRGQIAVPAGAHEGPCKAVCCLVDPPADQGDGAPRIERLTLDRRLVLPTRLVQRQIHPAQSLVVPPEPRLRGAVQQRQARRSRELGPFSP